jgi:very-short-patch-repair endonuclease
MPKSTPKNIEPDPDLNPQIHLEPDQAEIRAALAQLRKKLLDLTSHNPLISFKHAKNGRYIRLVDELPNNIVEQLLEERKLIFEPVIEPTELEVEEWVAAGGALKRQNRRDLPAVEDWAEKSGILASYDLPVNSDERKARRFVSTKLQTLHYPSVLESRLSNLYRLSRSMIEETGTNLLHLTFGFLEWYEAGVSEKAHFAPLYTIPVALEKGSIDRKTNTYQYTLQTREDEVQFNASIATRLADDYSFILPELAPEHTPEGYMDDVEYAIATRFPRWKVHRWGTLSMLNFSRLLMYRDLDPDNWPEGHSLANHPLVKAVICNSECEMKGENDQAPIRNEMHEYNIDEVENIYDEFPLVDVADSSQHSALIDAIRGKNLVIQGPPGTGKSQTITNLIAAAMNKGLSVLFVSEKLAALDVVRHRMEKMGLGEFCLELHSHNSKKIGVVESFKRRLGSHFRDSKYLDLHAERHGKLAGELNLHARRVNQSWKQTGLTAGEILLRCSRYLAELKGLWADLRIEGMNGNSWKPVFHLETLVEFESYGEQLRRIAKELGEGQSLEQHPWRAVKVDDLDGSSISRIMELLRNWEIALRKLCEALADFPGGYGVLGIDDDSEDVRSIFAGISCMPPEEKMVDWEHLGEICESGLNQLDGVLSLVDEITERCAKLGNLSLLEVIGSDDLTDLDERIDALVLSGVDPATPLDRLYEIREAVDQVLMLVNRWAERCAEFHHYAEGNIPPFMDPNGVSLDGLRQLEEIIELNKQLAAGDLDFRNAALLPRALKKDAEVFRSRINALRSERELQEMSFELKSVRENLDLAKLKEILSETSLVKRLIRSDYRQAKKAVRAAMRDPKGGWNPNSIPKVLGDLESFLKDEQEFKADEKWVKALGLAFSGIDTDVDRFERLVFWHAELEARFSQGDERLFSDTELTETGKWLLGADEKLVAGLQRFEETGLSKDLKLLNNQILQIVTLYGYDEAPKTSALSESDNEWRLVLDYLKEALPEIIARLNGFGSARPKTLNEASERLDDYMEIRADWQAALRIFAEANETYFENRLPDSPLPTGELRDAVAVTRKWCRWVDDGKTLQPLVSKVLSCASSEFIGELRQWLDGSYTLFESEQDARSAFESFVSLDRKAWSDDGSYRVFGESIAAAGAAEELLPSYLTFLRLRGILIRKGFASVCAHAEEHGMAEENCRSVFEYLVNATLADEIFQEDVCMRRFDGGLHSRKLADFKKTDHGLQKETRIRTARQASQREIPDGYRGARVSEFTDLALIEREVEKQKRHLPLRQLIRRAGRAALGLKPCFMMGPRSVAQYLEPGAIEFDLLVIDEASQMRPADALGAVARCKQLVVVGDSKQLAPSSFFDRISNADDDDEDQFEATVSESILDAVAPVFSRRQLRWHYRSRHPSLIAFSNLHFYENRLMLFPSPHFSGEALGISFQYHRDGVFEGQVNLVEAQALVARVVELILKDRTVSLGVATMNAKQRDLIERLLEEEAKNDASFAEAWEENRLEDEPLFVKNLENVQGDEREIMIISCTYGRTESGGRVMQRFGPINSADGGRRLNVLFTRSRTRMEIFSSMLPSDIIISEKSSDGVKALRGMLRYAETGVIEGAVSSGREPDSDFEISVARLLELHGYEVECQIGVAGFFIDLGVKHPHRNGEYIMGVECDGAAYHSSKSARDRDRIRQDVLESMGWTIGRIWSTDWFADPTEAIKPILKQIESLLENS